MESVILTGIVAAVAAGLACSYEHSYAERHGWKELERYAAGGLTWWGALVPVLFAAFPIEWAVLIALLSGVILGSMGLATWASCQKPRAMPKEQSPIAKKIDKELDRP